MILTTERSIIGQQSAYFYQLFQC